MSSGGNLTIDRPTATAAVLNSFWDMAVANIATMMPTALRYIDSRAFDDLTMDEDDVEAISILRQGDILQAIANKANRMFFNTPSLSWDLDDDGIGIVDLYDDAYDLGVNVLPNFFDTEGYEVNEELKYYEANPDWSSDFWDLQNNISQLNKWLIDGSPYRVTVYDDSLDPEQGYFRDMIYGNRYRTNTQYQNGYLSQVGSVPLDGTIVTGSNNQSSQYMQSALYKASNNVMQTTFSMTGSNKQINMPTMNMSLKERLNISAEFKRSGLGGCRTNACALSKPISDCINVTDPNAIIDNAYMKLSTGDLFPLRFLPKTAFENAILQKARTERGSDVSTSTATQTIATITFDVSVIGNPIVTKTDKRVNNTTGIGWFSNGFLGSETFDGTGSKKEWNPGDSRILSRNNLGYKNTDLNVIKYDYGNGYNEWFSDKAYKLGESERFEGGWKEGRTPSIPNNSLDLLYVTENLSSQCTGSNAIFKLSSLYETGTLHVYWNGVRQSDIQITELSSTTFGTSFVPSSIGVLIVDYMPL